jgi:hypothetical protein
LAVQSQAEAFIFLARRPSPWSIDRFLGDSQELPLSYGPIGIVRDEAVRHGLDEAIVVIGRGKADFERARAALIAWNLRRESYSGADGRALGSHADASTAREVGSSLLADRYYLPKAHATEPQRFRYTTRIAFGLELSGEGETVAQRNLPDGSCFSALRFGSGEPWSIIREGSGYWKYIPTSDGIRFLTWYDYRTRFGAVGTLFVEQQVRSRPLEVRHANIQP